MGIQYGVMIRPSAAGTKKRVRPDGLVVEEHSYIQREDHKQQIRRLESSLTKRIKSIGADLSRPEEELQRDAISHRRQAVAESRERAEEEVEAVRRAAIGEALGKDATLVAEVL